MMQSIEWWYFFCYDLNCQILFVVLGCAGTPDPVTITIRLARLESTKQFYDAVLPLITKIPAF